MRKLETSIREAEWLGRIVDVMNRSYSWRTLQRTSWTGPTADALFSGRHEPVLQLTHSSADIMNRSYSWRTLQRTSWTGPTADALFSGRHEPVLQLTHSSADVFDLTPNGWMRETVPTWLRKPDYVHLSVIARCDALEQGSSWNQTTFHPLNYVTQKWGGSILTLNHAFSNAPCHSAPHTPVTPLNGRIRYYVFNLKITIIGYLGL